MTIMKQTTTLKKPKILAVDDYPANIIAFEAVLADVPKFHI